MARTPKHHEERLRRNKPVIQPEKLPLHHSLPTPRLPRSYKWTTAGKEYWKTIWESPMAVVFLPADFPALVRATLLTEVIAEGNITQGILSELRQLEDRFGLSPLARRRLQWDIDKAMGQDQPSEMSEGFDDDRFLRVVGG